jgi:hypothetical protein
MVVAAQAGRGPELPVIEHFFDRQHGKRSETEPS